MSNFDFLMATDSWVRPYEDAIKALDEIVDAGESDRILEHDPGKGTLSITCNGHGLRRDVSSSEGVGYIEKIRLDDDLVVSLDLLTPTKPFHFRTMHGDCLSIGVRLQGMQEVTTSLNTADDNILFLGAFNNKQRIDAYVPANETFKTLHFSTSKIRNNKLVDVHVPSLAALLDDCSEESLEAGLFFTHDKAQSSVRRCTNELLLSNEFEGQMRFDFIRAKVNVLLCYIETQCAELLHDKTIPAQYISATERVSLMKVRDCILQSPGSDMRIPSLAKDVGMNENKLIALFRNEFHITIHQYVIKIRMEFAQRLLYETELPVKDIAHEVGYRNLSAFGRAFKSYFGVGPSKSRNRP